MSDSNQNNDAYVFVDASTKEADNSYSVKPAHPYVFPAWEWLLERTLRRSLILEYFNKDAALAVLATRMKNYRMHRWPSYGVSSYYWSCTAFPDADFRFRYTNHCHDGSLAARSPTLSISGSKRSGKFRVDTDEYANYSVESLASMVDDLLDNRQFLAPDWAPPSGEENDGEENAGEENGYRVESSLVETTTGQCDKTGHWSWTTKIGSFSPFELPKSPFFRLLTDTRVDEPAVTVTIEDSDGNTRRVKLAKTIPAYTEDNLRTYHGVKVLYAGYHGVNTLESLAFRTQTDMTGTSGSLEGDGPYASATGRTDVETVAVTIPGPIERKQGSAVYVDIYSGNDTIGFVQPDVDWGGELHEPTWWHANGFPKGLDSVTSGKMKRQLEALSVTQPAIPPVVLCTNEFPENGYDCFDDIWTGRRWFHIGNSWPGNTVAIAATPHCISKMLDALKKTVFEVPALFFEVDATVETETIDERFHNEERGEGDGPSSGKMDELPKISEYTTEEKDTYEGTVISDAPLDLYGDHEYDDISDTYTSDLYEVSKWSSTLYGETTKTWYRYETLDTTEYSKKKTISLKNPVILRGQGSTTASVKHVHSTKTSGPAYNTPIESSSESGSIPDSMNPAESDLMFPAWLRKWIAKAELFMSYKAVLYKGSPNTRTETRTTTKPDNRPTTIVYSGSGSGNRTTKATQGVVSLGEMDLTTGKFPDIDLVKLRSKLVPEGGGNRDTAYRYRSNTDTSYVKTYVSNSDTASPDEGETETRVSITEIPPGATYNRSSKLFVVVEWKFDNESPEPFGEQLAERAALLAAMKASDAAKQDLLAAQDAVRHAENEVVARNKALEEAQEALDRAEHEDPPDQARVEELRQAVEEAQTSLSEAEDALQSAEDAVAEKEQAVTEADQTATEKTEDYRSALENYAGPLR